LAEVPAPVRPLWDVFVMLSAGRRTAMGPHPLTYTDIAAWSQLHGLRLNSWELDTLVQVDAASVAEAVARMRKETPKEKR